MEPFAGEETRESEAQSPNQEEQTFPGLLPSPIISDQKLVGSKELPDTKNSSRKLKLNLHVVYFRGLNCLRPSF